MRPRTRALSTLPKLDRSSPSFQVSVATRSVVQAITQQHAPDVLAVPDEPPGEEVERHRGEPRAVGHGQVDEVGVRGVGREEAEGRHPHVQHREDVREPGRQGRPPLQAARHEGHEAEHEHEVGHVRPGDPGDRQRVDLAEGQVGDREGEVEPGAQEGRGRDRHEEGRPEEQHRLAVLGDVDEAGRSQARREDQGQRQARPQLAPRATRGECSSAGRRGGALRERAGEALGVRGHAQRAPRPSSMTLNVSRMITQVEEERHVLHVVEVELELPLPVLDGRAVPELDLGPAGDPGRTEWRSS